MRGKRLIKCLTDNRGGITPACAGKTSPARAQSPAGWDHPRVCGENKKRQVRAAVMKGSPPRVRGKLDLRVIFHSAQGITPACAGKTVVDCVAAGDGGDHPRVCGENSAFAVWYIAPMGSPPRVRGKPRGFHTNCGAAGITPACAGKTLRKWRISVVDPSPQPRSSLTSRRADASIGSQRAPCAAPV